MFNCRFLTHISFIMLGLAILYGCDKMDDTYREFTKNGEQVYLDWPDSIRVYPGDGRIQLSWLLTDNPNAVLCKVFWNNGNDSVALPVTHTGLVDSVSVIIDNLIEGIHDFTIYVYDKDNDRSIGKDTTGMVYGDAYRSTLQNRTLSRAVFYNDVTYLTWSEDADTTVLGTELYYRGSDNTEHRLWVAPGERNSVIDAVPLDKEIKFRTLFIPDSNVIDTFRTEFQMQEVHEAQVTDLDKSLFSEVSFPEGAVSAWPLSGLWDDYTSINSKGFKDSEPFPKWISIDLGQNAMLSEIRIWGVHDGREFSQSNIKHFQVWGSNDPAEDGSYNGWELIQDCIVEKPSGLPNGQLSDDDKQAAADGIPFPIESNPPAIRYLRIKMLSNFDSEADPSKTGSWLIEISLRGIVL